MPPPRRPADEVPTRPAPPRAGAVTRTRYTRGTLVWLTAPLAAGLVLVVLYLAREPRRPADTLAVLPFAMGNGGAATEVLGDGLREALAGSLARLPRLTVVAAGSVPRVEGTEVDPRRLGRDLGVRTVVTGRVDRQGEALAVGAELLSVADGARLWGGTFVRPASDLLVVRDELAVQIALALRPQLTATEVDAVRRRPTGDLVAYRLYAQGRHHLERRTAQGREGAVACFKQAIHADPSFALAHAALAAGYVLLGTTGVGTHAPQEVSPLALAAAARAVELDSGLAEGHAALGLAQRLFERDRAAAERSLQRAIELGPSYAPAYLWYGETLAELGRPRAAERAIRRARELDPLSPAPLAGLGRLAYQARDFGKAVEHLRAALALDPSDAPARRSLALAYAQQSAFAQALLELDGAAAGEAGDTSLLAAKGYVLGRAGRGAEARAVAADLQRLAAERYVPAYRVAEVLMGAGDIDAALNWLGKACDARCPLLGALGVDPALDPLRADPRFGDLLRCTGLAR